MTDLTREALDTFIHEAFHAKNLAVRAITHPDLDDDDQLIVDTFHGSYIAIIYSDDDSDGLHFYKLGGEARDFVLVKF